MGNTMRVSKWLLLISGILLVLLGVHLLFNPIERFVMVAIFIGATLFLSGVSEIATYFDEIREARSGWLLASGIISTVVGMWILMGRGAAILTAILPIIFAIWVIASSFIRIVHSVARRSQGYPVWGLSLVLGLLGILAGTVLFFQPLLSALIISLTIAVMFIIYGAESITLFFGLNRLDKLLHS